jgi:hypothetical protein
MRTLIKAILPLCLLLTFAGAAAAQTPDGSTPSQETVCDGQTGAAYGLCTAFCEAMDCDSADPQASQTACDKVGAKFLTITGQAPPCVVPACPCVGGIPGFLEALNSQFGLTSCRERAAPFEVFTLTTGDGLNLIYQSDPASGSLCGFNRERPIGLSQAEAAACNALLRQKAAAAGLTCTPF